MTNDTERALEFYKHADGLIVGRANFLLVAQSMLVAAFATLCATNPDGSSINLRVIEIVVALVGIAFSAFHCVLIVSLKDRLTAMETHLKGDRIFESYQNPWRIPYINRYATPGVLALMWGIFLYLAIIS